MQLEEEVAVGEVGAIVEGAAKANREAVANSASSRRYSPDLRQRSKFVMAMSLPRREASAAEMPKLMRSRSASLRARSLAS
eukprot:3735472-Pleurochrysis_carterae.AAC.1